jgi:tetratricopeptide (TPR) repeat protein
MARKKKAPGDARADSAAETRPAEEASITARETWIDRVGVAVAALVAFGATLPYPLVPTWDDGRFLIDDDLVQRPSVAALWSILSEPHFEAYHPLHLLSYWIDVPWLGPVGWAVRTTNLALFVLAGWAMLGWLRALGVSRWASLLGTLLFVVHPVQVELVVWGTGRKDVLAALFGLSAWTAHLRSRGAWDRDAWISRGLFVLACLSKTSAVPLPLAMLVVDVWLRRRTLREAALAQLPAIALAVALGALTYAIWIGNGMVRSAGNARSSLVLVLATASHAMEIALAPARTSPLYALIEDDPPGVVGMFAGVLVLGLALAAAWRGRDSTLGQRVGAGVSAFLVLWAPVSNVVPTHFELQDRHLSLPLVGLALAVAALVEAFAASRGPASKPATVVLVTGALLVVPLTARTLQYERVWRSDRTLWAHATSTHPRSYYAWIKLGEIRRDEGRFDAAGDAYRNAVEIEPGGRLAYAGLLMVIARQEERDFGIAPSQAGPIVSRYLAHENDAEQLRGDAAELVEQRYRRTALYFLGRSLDIDPIADERLEHAADVQLQLDHEWLARFYVGRMTRRPVQPRVARFFDEERERLGLLTPEERARLEAERAGSGSVVITPGAPSP